MRFYIVELCCLLLEYTQINVVTLHIILMCIYHFIFFTNDLLVAVYFVFILDYENDITQKQIQVIFLLKFKMDCKEAETTRNINNTFGPGTANEHTV